LVGIKVPPGGKRRSRKRRGSIKKKKKRDGEDQPGDGEGRPKIYCREFFERTPSTFISILSNTVNAVGKCDMMALRTRKSDFNEQV
jgi:hypothetical protein